MSIQNCHTSPWALAYQPKVRRSCVGVLEQGMREGLGYLWQSLLSADPSS